MASNLGLLFIRLVILFNLYTTTIVQGDVSTKWTHVFKKAVVLISKSVLQYERSPIIKRWNNLDFPSKRCKYCNIRWHGLSPELTGFFVARDVGVRVVGIGFEVAALLQNPAKELGLRIFWTIRTRPPPLLLLPAFLILRRTERACCWWAMVSWSLVFPSFSF